MSFSSFTSFNCKICLNNFTNSSVLSCSHPVCHQCIKAISVQQSVVCPVCWKMTYLQKNSESPLHLNSNNNRSICSSLSASKSERNLLSRFDDVAPVIPEYPIQLQENTQNNGKSSLVINIVNGSLKVEMLKETAVEIKENCLDTKENSKCLQEEIILCEDDHEDNIEMEIVNGKLKLKPLRDGFIQKVESVSHLGHLNLSVSCKEESLDYLIAKETLDEEYRVQMNSARKSSIDNLNTTEETSIEETKISQKKGSNVSPLCKLSIGKKNFIPKFGTHHYPSKIYRVKITSVVNPYRLYIQILDDDILRLEVLIKRLQVKFSQVKREALEISAIRNPPEGYACAVFHDCSWRRGIVKSQGLQKKNEANGKVQVMLVDTGLCCLVCPRHVQPIHESFLELPAQAVRCKLTDILRFELKGKSSASFFNLHRYWPLQVMDLVQKKEKQKAEIFVCDFLSGGVGSTPSTKEATVLVKMFVDGEHTSVNQQIDETNELVLRNFACSSTNPLNSKIIEPISEEHSTSARSSIDTPSSPTCFRSENICPLKNKKECQRKSNKLSQWNFSDPKTTLPECFNGVVTWVDDGGGFFVHNSIWSKQLILIRDTLNAAFNRTDSPVCDIRCQPEDSCLAKYRGNWYRAVVKFVKKRENTALVFLVDYGATVKVGFCDIRMDVILGQIPVQTFRCSLHNLMPTKVKEFNVMASWPENVIDNLHAAAVNQEFNMNVKSYFPLSIALRFLKNLMDLTDIVVANY